jgi:hypothetical protein
MMPHVIPSLALALVFALPVSGQPITREPAPADLVRGVTRVRLMFLRDSTPIDFCALPELFGADGDLPRDPRQPPAKYASLRECANASPGSQPYPFVTVLRRTMVGDTVVLHGVTDRRGFAFAEEYHFIPPFGRSVPLYRIGAWVER